MAGSYWKSLSASVSGGTRNVLANLATRFLGVASVRESKRLDGYCFSYNRTVSNVTLGQAVGVVIQTPNTNTYGHFRIQCTSVKPAVAGVYEGPTTSGGTTAVPFNMNRNASASPTVTLKVAPTVTSTGTLLNQIPMIAGSAMTQPVDWVLKANTKYLVAVKSAVGGNTISVRLEWYEHQDLT